MKRTIHPSGIPYELRSKDNGTKVYKVTHDKYSYHCPKTDRYYFEHEVYKFVSLSAKVKA